MSCGSRKRKAVVSWSPPSYGVLKFNVAGAVRGKLGLAGMGCYEMEKGCFCVCSRKEWAKDSNKAEVLAILEALRIFARSFHGSLIIERDSSNAVTWVN